jgi:hypothetical protein
MLTIFFHPETFAPIFSFGCGGAAAMGIFGLVLEIGTGRAAWTKAISEPEAHLLDVVPPDHFVHANAWAILGMLRNDEEGCQEDTRGDGVRASASKLQI